MCGVDVPLYALYKKTWTLNDLSSNRSTPCPNVKHGDEWGDPAACENGDSCGYCHTRTEQQFHPEVSSYLYQALK